MALDSDKPLIRDTSKIYISPTKDRAEIYIDNNWETYWAEKYLTELERRLRLIAELAETKKIK